MNFEYASQLAKECGLQELTSTVIDVSAFLSPDHIIPCDVINEEYSFVESQGKARLEVNSVVVREVLDILTKSSLFQSYSRDSFRVHRLVQQVIQSRLTEERRQEVLLCGVRMLNFAFDNILNDDEAREVPNYKLQKGLSTLSKLMPHAYTLTSHWKESPPVHFTRQSLSTTLLYIDLESKMFKSLLRQLMVKASRRISHMNARK